MIGVAAFAAGALVSAGLWSAMQRQFAESPVLARSNYRGHSVPVAAGIVIVLAAVVCGALYVVAVAVGGVSAAEARRGATVLGGVAVGFGFIGLLDDLLGTTGTRGFAGHLGALRHGEITTGAVKLVGGVLVGVTLVPGDLVQVVRAGLLIAAAANVGNLFDRAPGRVIKLGLVGAIAICAAGAPAWHLTGPLVVLGAGAGLLVADLRERCMVGDTGSNVLGAAIGWGLVIALGPTGQWIVLAVMVALNLAGEFVSFTRVIDAVPPLRWFDRLGTLPQRSALPDGPSATT